VEGGEREEKPKRAGDETGGRRVRGEEGRREEVMFECGE